MDREYLASVLAGGRGFVILPCKEGVVSGQDIDENYRLVSNDACPEGMPSLSFFLVMKEWGKQLKKFLVWIFQSIQM